MTFTRSRVHTFNGPNLRKLRTDSAKSRELLAIELGCTAESVKAWENGSREPTLATAASLAIILRVSLDELVRREASTDAA
ncbi:helix-turn-helix domain-containing protein [Kineococcus aurantiacus]|uniref:Transcriptional regulator with XRE-family HTH domain n=1 Tax=Kineococcus aurantiacus TaxID=37633 RepID=A0A7Y9AV35_9ACTN|nr:helix-turn-helix transcriptional regulator [Kineococcus aurantiacus]NYD20940.1 transcriptional regulator with XRE-family HTH domain [Kineococcus aurantiacus]